MGVYVSGAKRRWHLGSNAELPPPKAREARFWGCKLDIRTEQLADVRRDLKTMRAELRGHFGYGGLVGTSSVMRKVYALIERIKG